MTIEGPTTPAPSSWVAHNWWRAMNMVLTAPATSSAPRHDFESGTAIAATLAVKALRDAPLPVEPDQRHRTKEN